MLLILTFLFGAILNLIQVAVLIPMPVSDTSRVRYNTFPWATLLLIGLCTFIYLAFQAPDLIWLSNAESRDEMVNAFLSEYDKVWTFGFRDVFLHEAAGYGANTSFSSIFMHADVSHLFGNMVFLWAFGRRVEDACGSWRFLLFYLIAGMTANIGTALILSDDVPGIGASGAIMGVLGAYVVLFPGTKIDCLWGIGLPLQAGWIWIQRNLRDKKVTQRWTVQLPALIVVGFFIVFDFIHTFETLDTGELVDNVNYVAHATGFLSAIAVLLLVRKDLFTKYFTARNL